MRVDGESREGYQVLGHLLEVEAAHLHALDALVEVLLQLDDLGDGVAVRVVQHVVDDGRGGGALAFRVARNRAAPYAVQGVRLLVRVHALQEVLVQQLRVALASPLPFGTHAANMESAGP